MTVISNGCIQTLQQGKRTTDRKKNTGSFRNKKKATLDENIKLLNRDEGKFVSVNTWTPLFAKMIRTDITRQRNQNISDAK